MQQTCDLSRTSQFEARKREEERQKTEVARLVNSPGRAVVDNVDTDGAPVIDNPGRGRPYKMSALPNLSMMSMRVRKNRYIFRSSFWIILPPGRFFRAAGRDTTVAIDNIDKAQCPRTWKNQLA
jgi:hypothetical protein